MRQFVLVLFIGVLLGGCAVGNTHRYDLGDAELTLKSSKTIAVSTLDSRSYIISGEKTRDFVGLQRGGFGNPFGVTTDSGRPLSEDMTRSIVEAMRISGVTALAVTLGSSDPNSAIKTLLSEEADRYVLLILREWKADTYVNTNLIHDVTLQVLEGDGNKLAEKRIRGEENLGAALIPADSRVNTEKAFKAKLEALLNDPAIVEALK